MTSTTETKSQNDAVDNVAKEKKTKLPKEKKPKTTKTASHHPPYFQMIKEALVALNEKKGSSPHAIAKYMEEKHKAVLPENFKKMLTLQLKNSASKGKLTKVKASYKLSDESTTTSKKQKAASDHDGAAKNKPKSKRLSAKATETKTKKGGKKQQGVVKKKAKKMTPAKPKQAKSIKSPAAKMARKASV